MTVKTTAGTTIAISAGVPATFNSAGYAALSYTSIGEVTNFGEFGRVYQLVTHNPVSSRGTQKFKGSYNEGTMNLQLGLDTDDAGQVLAKTASTSDSLYYFQAMVMSFNVNLGEVNSITSAACTLEVTTSSTGVGIVEVLA
jgi:hypothetical protein